MPSNYDRSHVTVATVAGFAGVLIGLLAPVYMFAQRLTIQEERMSVVVVGVSDLRKDIQRQGEGLNELKIAMAERGSITPIRKKQP